MPAPDWYQVAQARGTIHEDASILGELLAIKWGKVQQDFLDNEFTPAVAPLPAADQARIYLSLAETYRTWADGIENGIRTTPGIDPHLP